MPSKLTPLTSTIGPVRSIAVYRLIRGSSARHDERSFSTEDEAETYARELAAPGFDVVSQVTLYAYAGGDSFAGRHLTVSGDSGWRCWVDGKFVGAPKETTS